MKYLIGRMLKYGGVDLKGSYQDLIVCRIS